MAEVTTTLAKARALQPGSLGKAFHVLLRWPLLPVFFLAAFVIMAILAPVVAPHDPVRQNLRARAAPPIWNSQWYDEHPNITARYILGADHVGRDVFSRIVYGARVSLLVASISLSTGLLVGTTLGLVSGYFGGHVDELVMRLVDIWLSLPFLLIALVATIVFGSSFSLVMGLLALLAWSAFVRNVRAEVLSLKQRDYVALARVSGASSIRIITKHLLPGVINTVIVIATLRVGQLILAEASLSFLGAGIPAPTPAWGLMVAEGRDYLTTAWWISFFPGLAIFLIVMSLNFLGDWLRDRLDPRLRQL